MAIGLVEHEWPAKLVKSGSAVLSVTAGEGVQVRHGTLANPVMALQEQCPEGKAWSVRVIVEIEEIDA